MRSIIVISSLIAFLTFIPAFADQTSPNVPVSTMPAKTSNVLAPTVSTPETKPVSVPQASSLQLPVSSAQNNKIDNVKTHIESIKNKISNNAQFLSYKDVIFRSLKGLLIGIGAFLVFIILMIFIKKRNVGFAKSHNITEMPINTNPPPQKATITDAVINYIKHKY